MFNESIGRPNVNSIPRLLVFHSVIVFGVTVADAEDITEDIMGSAITEAEDMDEEWVEEEGIPVDITVLHVLREPINKSTTYESLHSITVH